MIRQALVALLNAKGSNVIARSAGGRPTAIVDDAGKQVDEIPAAPQMATQLRDARQQAQRVQGEDPLANTVPSNVSIDELGLTDASQIGNRTSSLAKDPSRLPDNSLGITNDLPEEAGIRQAEIDAYKELDAPEVPGSNETITLFEQLMDDAGSVGAVSPPHFQRLKYLDPELAEHVRLTARQNRPETATNNDIWDELNRHSLGEDDIPF